MFAAFIAFNTAEWAIWVAILVFAYDRGGAQAAAFVAVMQLVPAIFVAPMGAVLGDRLPRDRALALGYLIQSVAVGAAALALWLPLPIPIIYGFAVMTNCAIRLTRPVHHAILPELAETPQQLTASNSASSTIEGLSSFVGPIITAILLETVGAWSVFALMSMALAMAAALTVRLRRHDLGVGTSRTSGSLLTEGLEGFRALRRDPTAALLIGLVGAQFVVVGMLDVLTVVLALTILGLGQSGPGLMTSAAGVGIVVGAACTVVLIGRSRLTWALFLGIFTMGVPLALVALIANPAAAAALLAVSGGGAAFFGVAARTLIQRTVDEEVLARVFGLQEAMLMLGLSIGAATAPLLVRTLHPRGAFVAAGVFLPAIAALTWARLIRVDEKAHVPGPELAILRSIPFFQFLDVPVLERLSRDLVPVDISAGTVVIKEGDPGDRFYVVAEGSAEITFEGRHVADCGPGGYFGEIALLRDVPRTATVTASSDLRLLALEREDFLSAVIGSPPSAEAAHSEVHRRLKELSPPVRE